MIAMHGDVLNASDNQTPWAENCLVCGFKDNQNDYALKYGANDYAMDGNTLCLDIAFRDDCGIGYEPAIIANQAILKMMGK